MLMTNPRVLNASLEKRLNPRLAEARQAGIATDELGPALGDALGPLLGAELGARLGDELELQLCLVWLIIAMQGGRRALRIKSNQHTKDKRTNTRLAPRETCAGR
jgi:hypothetical protein